MDIKKNKNNIKISIFSNNQILNYSYGEIKNSNTLNYKDFSPVNAGLFCNKIFGSSTKKCDCGRTFSYDNFNFICNYCGVETSFDDMNFRRTRSAHIKLNDLFVNPLYCDLNPYYLSIITNFSRKTINNLLYKNYYLVFYSSLKFINLNQILSPKEYFFYKKKYFDNFYALTGFKAIYYFIKNIDIDFEILKIKNYFKKNNFNFFFNSNHKKKIKRYEILNYFSKTRSNLINIFISSLIVLPPDLRPIIKLPDETIVSSDLNELYKRIIDNNIRLKKIKKYLFIPKNIIYNEISILQKHINNLFIGGGKNNDKPLKSLLENLKGKSGFFRNNLLGKRVDYSGRAVIVSGSDLNFGECAIPQKIALEIFRPFIYKKILENKNLNIKTAKFEVDKMTDFSLSILYELVKNFYIILNRAPTLHRLGVQSFKILITSEDVIKLHPLNCPAFNADFDGDQMAVHLPLSIKSRIESKNLLFSKNNILYPANGGCCISPTKDISLGIYYFTRFNNILFFDKYLFNSYREAILAFYCGYINFDTIIFIRFKKYDQLNKIFVYKIWKTSLGRIVIFNLLPVNSFDYNYINKTLTKNDTSKILDSLSKIYSFDNISLISDNLMRLGFNFATISGFSLCIDDMFFNYRKKNILKFCNKILMSYDLEYLNFFLTRNSKKRKIFNLWDAIMSIISSGVMKDLSYSKFLDKNNLFFKINSLHFLQTMVESGARGSESQIKQICSNRGLINYKKYGIFETPVISSLRDGLNVFEYFYFSHNSRKTLADTALKTSSAGYLTRRLVEISNNIFVSEYDCETKEGINLKILTHQGEIIEDFYDRIFGRVLLNDLKVNNTIIFNKNTIINSNSIILLKNLKFNSLKVRSILKCNSKIGVCSLCYGLDLSKNKVVALGEMVGIIAAQSIGEPGTQLTMRTFHSGGVVSKFIKKSFYKSNSDGFLKYSDSLKYVIDRNNFKIVISKFGKIKIFNYINIELESFYIPYSSNLLVDNNIYIKKGDIICKWLPDYNVVVSEFDGILKFDNFIHNVNFFKKPDLNYYEIINKKKNPNINIIENNTEKCLKTYYLNINNLVMFNDGDFVKKGDILIKTPLDITITGSIIGGLPKIDNFFEARKPQNSSFISPVSGIVKIKNVKNKFYLNIVDDNFNILFNTFLNSPEKIVVFENQKINIGDVIIEGDLNPHDILFIYGIDYFVDFLLSEIKSIYFSQGVQISDKHLELIISQMLKSAIIISPGNSTFISGEIVLIEDINNFNDKCLKPSNKINYEVILTGITKQSLRNKSFISAASFQKTSSVLSKAAIFSSQDNMKNLKNIVMTGKIFPGGSGFYNKILNF